MLLLTDLPSLHELATVSAANVTKRKLTENQTLQLCGCAYSGVQRHQPVKQKQEFTAE